MCKAWRDQYDSGKEEGREEARLDSIRNMFELGLSREQILTKYSKEEVEKAEKSMLAQI